MSLLVSNAAKASAFSRKGDGPCKLKTHSLGENLLWNYTLATITCTSQLCLQIKPPNCKFWNYILSVHLCTSQLCLQVMAPNRKIFALKRIKLQGKDSEASKGFVDEITLLQRLRGKQNIIQLVDAEVTPIALFLPFLSACLTQILVATVHFRISASGADAYKLQACHL